MLHLLLQNHFLYSVFYELFYSSKILKLIQGTLAEGEDKVQLIASLRQLVL